MSGQSAHLTLKEARAMQERVQQGSNHSHTHGGGGSKKASTGDSTHRTKKAKLADVVTEK